MTRGVAVAIALAAFGLSVSVGCASSPDEEPLTGVDPTDPNADDGGDAPAKSIKIPKKDAGAPKPSGTAAAGDDDDDTTPPGNTSSSSSGGAPPPPAVVQSDPCAQTTCISGDDVNPIAGDTGSDVRNLTGSVNQWFSLDVAEKNNALTGAPMGLRATLTSPPGENFDLYVYTGSDVGLHECHTVAKSSANATGDDKVSLSWGETSFANGSDDTRTISIEVRQVVDRSAPPAATCDNTTPKWTLKLEGNKQ